MARILIDSFETQKLDLWNTYGAPSIVSTAGLTLKGDYCCHCANTQYIYKNFTNLNRIGVSFLWRFYNSSSYLVNIGWTTGTIYIRVASGKLHYSMFGGVAYGAIPISLNTTYFVQIDSYYSGGDVCVILRLNGVLDYSNCSSRSACLVDNIRFGEYSYFDNIVIDDAVVPEKTEIAILKPNGIGNYSDFVPTPAGNNYTCVDEVPYNDSDFVSSGIVNAIDTYTLEDIPSAKSVKCVQMHARARKDSDSPLTKFNFVMRNGSTDYHGSDVLLSNIFSSYCEMRLNGPTGSGIWRPSNIASLEIGVRTRT